MSDKTQQPLPFVYQFAAGAVAGVSEVWNPHNRLHITREIIERGILKKSPITNAPFPARTDPGDVRFRYRSHFPPQVPIAFLNEPGKKRNS